MVQKINRLHEEIGSEKAKRASNSGRRAQAGSAGRNQLKKLTRIHDCVSEVSFYFPWTFL